MIHPREFSLKINLLLSKFDICITNYVNYHASMSRLLVWYVTRGHPWYLQCIMITIHFPLFQIQLLLCRTTIMTPGGWINIKMSSYQYRKSHCGDKMILRPSYLHNGISYTGKTTSLYWIGALDYCILSNLWRIIWEASGDAAGHSSSNHWLVCLEIPGNPWSLR